ncbi:MAG: NADPH:quinone reductase [Tepidisphaeraceae bacterium]
MKAIRVHAFGDPSVLNYEDVPDPKAGEGELLIHVRAIGVNPVDTYVRAGAYAMKPALPYTPGTELAGEVVDGPRKGERVFALGTTGPRNTGCYAELAVVRSSDAHRLPDHLSFAQGAAVPVAFGTAYRALVDRANVRPGDAVLIHGASGGVGTAAVQIAALLGATVIGTASTDAGRKLVRECGAMHVMNHREASYLDQIKLLTGGRGVDVVIEMLANVNLDHDLDLLVSGGRVVIIGSRGRIEIDPRKTMAKESIVTGVMLWAAGDGGLSRAFAFISAGLARGGLKPIVQTELPLARAAEAHELVLRDGSGGKVVLVP